MISRTSSGLHFLQDLREDLGAKLKEFNSIGDLLVPWAGTAASDSFAESKRSGKQARCSRSAISTERINEGKGQMDDFVSPPGFGH